MMGKKTGVFYLHVVSKRSLCGLAGREEKNGILGL